MIYISEKWNCNEGKWHIVKPKNHMRKWAFGQDVNLLMLTRMFTLIECGVRENRNLFAK